MKILSMESAAAVWNAHREIAVGEKLREQMLEAMKRGEDPNPVDPFGRQRKCSFGVPSGDNCQRMLDVEPKLAIAVIDGHIANNRRELLEACIAARIELGADEDNA
jgi:hypothetical protein